MALPSFSAADFRAALLRLLPTGRIWSREPGSMPYQLATVWAPTFQRSSARGANLITDGFPSTTVELLTEWEATLGLPDPCAGTSPTLEQRQAQVVARLTDSGGASKSYFIAFAKALGFDITITEFVPSRYGKTYGGTYGGDDWAFAWQVSIPAFTLRNRQYGDVYGEPYATWGSTVIQCEFSARKPAHTILLFDYSAGNTPGRLGSFILNIDTLGE
ncbi:YmfQ family protein [Komagataeibacter diospyri]|uniref:Bacteriophage tail protein n=1 Tax=Komagataeibacter diospyri TaxID=1932662 RepID=A0A4P5NU50_9PROT|nr:putative phage tail protein [Komagataeibacter diospyri]GCE83075.1 bacteriophage tail protein [Komagataeibacter diospyri]